MTCKAHVASETKLASSPFAVRFHCIVRARGWLANALMWLRVRVRGVHAMEQQELWRLPDVLVFHLRRLPLQRDAARVRPPILCDVRCAVVVRACCVWRCVANSVQLRACMVVLRTIALWISPPTAWI